jgi:hypothetical protein
VELNGALDAVRDSKNPAGAVLSVAALRVLVRDIQAGRFS